MSKLCDSCVGDKLNAAVDFCADHGLYFNYVNENCKEVVEQFGTESRKIFAHEYIDDRSSCKQYGLPLKLTIVVSVICQNVKKLRINVNHYQ